MENVGRSILDMKERFHIMSVISGVLVELGTGYLHSTVTTPKIKMLEQSGMQHWFETNSSVS